MKKIVLFFILCLSLSFVIKKETVEDNYFTIVHTIESELAKDAKYLSTKSLKYFKRFKRFWSNRIDNEGKFSLYTKNYTKSVMFLEKMPKSKNQNTWSLVGPQQFPVNKYNLNDRDRLLGVGHLKSVYIFPDNKNHILIGAQAGGLWETKNGGNNWRCLTNNIPAMTVRTIQVVNGIIYAAAGYHHTGKRFSNNTNQDEYGLGVIRSSDGGKTWQWNKETMFNCVGFSFHKSNKNIVYAVSSTTVYKSTDAGFTWKKQARLTESMYRYTTIDGVETHPTNPDVAYVYAYTKFKSSINSTLLHKTADGGKTWQSSNFLMQEAKNAKPLSFDKFNGVKLHYNEKEDALYASLLTNGLQNKSNRLLIYKTKNWNDWQLLSKQSSYGGTMLSNSLLVDNEDIYFGGVYLYHTTKGNFNFKNVSRKIHVDIRDLKMHSNTLFTATDGGLFSSDDKGKTWQNLSGDLNVIQAYSMSYTNNKGKRTISIGTQDDGYYRYNFDQKPWFSIEPWGEGANYTHPKLDNIIFTKNNNGYIYKSEDGGKTTKILWADKKVVRFLESETPILFHPKDDNTIITELERFGKNNIHGLYKSTDLGNSWSLLRQNNSSERVVALAQSKSKPNNLYLSTVTYDFSKQPWNYQSKLYLSSNNGIDYTEITNTLAKITNARINDIVVHPTKPNKIWICFGNLSANNKLFYSDDKGKTWQNHSYNLPNFPVNRIAFNDDDCKLYVGTDLGVFVQENKKWKRLGKNLPNTLVTDLVIDKKTNELFIGTYGRGIWKIDL